MAKKKPKGRMGYNGGGPAAAHPGGFSFWARQQAARQGGQPGGPGPSSFFAQFGVPPPPPPMPSPIYGAQPPQQQQPAPQPSREPSMWEAMFGRPAEAPKPAAAPAPVSRPGFVKARVDISRVFDIQGLYAYVVAQKAATSFRVPPGSVGLIPLVMIARPTRDAAQMIAEVAAFFQIPPTEIQRAGAQAWQVLIDPYLREVERALEIQKPKDLPGFFKIDFAEDGSLGLAYYERG